MKADLEFIDFPSLQTPLLEEEIQALAEYLRNTKNVSMGPENVAFEEDFKAYLGCNDAIALNSATSALEMCGVLAGLKPGDEVIVPAHTFVSSAVPFARRGAVIKWADIDPESFVIDPKSVQKLISDKTKLIIVVHLYGLPANMDAILDLTKDKKIYIVEDCAQAPGAEYKGKKVGTIGDFGCFSFHGHKNISTLGEGGILSLKDAGMGEYARKMRWMGNWPFQQKREKYWRPAMGNIVAPMDNEWPYNFCLGEPNAMLGRLLIKRLDTINDTRNAQAKLVLDTLKDFPELQFQKQFADRKSAYHLLPARYDGSKYGKTKDDLIDILFNKYKLKTVVQYWPLYKTDLFQRLNYGSADIPESDKFFDQMISFPWWSNMDKAVLKDMIERIKSALLELRS